MDMVTVKINGRDYEVPAGSKIIDAARIAKIDIPTLCYLKDVNEIGACRLCLVEVKGARSDGCLRYRGNGRHGDQNEHPQGHGFQKDQPGTHPFHS